MRRSALSSVVAAARVLRIARAVAGRATPAYFLSLLPEGRGPEAGRRGTGLERHLNRSQLPRAQQVFSLRQHTALTSLA